MKTIVVAVLLTCAAAYATGAIPSIPPKADNTLTSIDTVPTKEQINRAFEDNAQAARDTLIAIATTPDKTVDAEGVDPGLKLRAIHALAKYCGDPPTTPCSATDVAHQSVSSVVAMTRSSQVGGQILMLRAAIETLGTMKVSSDVTQLTPLLDHPSRDIRAATARALRDLCNAQAITFLRARYSNEMTDQVKLAISEALRILGQCTANP